MLHPQDLLRQLSMASQISTKVEGEKESDEVTLTFEDHRMLIGMGEYEYVFETEDANTAIAMAALMLQWASRKKRLEKRCACDEHGKVCMYHMNIDAQILGIVSAAKLSAENWG